MFVSVVIPTYNRRPILEKCLLLQCKQTLLKDRSAVVGRDNDANEHRSNRNVVKG